MSRQWSYRALPPGKSGDRSLPTVPRGQDQQPEYSADTGLPPGSARGSHKFSNQRAGDGAGASVCPFGNGSANIIASSWLRLVEARWCLVPRLAAGRLTVAVLVERPHVGLIELARLRSAEIGADVGKVVVDLVALAGEVGADHVVAAAGRQHRGDRPPGNRDGSALARRIVRIEPGVADDIGGALPPDAAGGDVDRRRVEEELGD